MTRQTPAKAASGDSATPKAAGGRTRRTALVVLGMHRSGTSALAGTMKLLGCDGPLTEMKPNPDNELGFFESSAIYRFHTELLASAGSAWDDWLRINSGWPESAPAADFADRAVALIGQEFGTSRLFVLKDPRICRLVPFWSDVLARSDAAPHFVLIHRNPLDVAASLGTRNGFDPQIGQLLWLRHVLDAEADTRGASRCFTSYDRLLDNWAAVAGDIQDGLGLRLPRFTQGTAAEVEAFLRPKLRHHETPPDRLLRNPLISQWTRSVYAIFEDWVATGEAPADFGSLDAVRSALAEAEMTFAPIVRAANEERRKATEGQSRIATLAEERDTLSAKLGSALDREEAAADRLAGAQKALEEATAEAEKSRTTATTLKADCEAARAEAEQARAEIERLEERLQAARNEQDQTRSALAQRSLEADETRAEVQDLVARAAEIEAAHSAALVAASAEREHAVAQEQAARGQAEARWADAEAALLEVREQLAAELELMARERRVREAAVGRLVEVERARHDDRSRSVAESGRHAREIEQAEARMATQYVEMAEITSRLASREDHVRSMEDTLRSKDADLASRTESAAAAHGAIASIKASTSWRLTAPIRAVGSLLRRG